MRVRKHHEAAVVEHEPGAVELRRDDRVIVRTRGVADNHQPEIVGGDASLQQGDEFRDRVETPHILLDKNGELKAVLDKTTSNFPRPDLQWIEDRFWIWVHYALLKIGRGEYLEAFDFFGFLRMVVFGPLLHIKNGNLPRGVRKVESDLGQGDFLDLKGTIPKYDRESLLDALRNSVSLYRTLRTALFDKDIELRTDAETRVMEYFDEVERSS